MHALQKKNNIFYKFFLNDLRIIDVKNYIDQKDIYYVDL